MCAFKCRRPTLPYFSLPVAVTRTRFLTLLFVLFLVAIGPILRARERGAGAPSWFPTTLLSEQPGGSQPAVRVKSFARPHQRGEKLGTVIVGPLSRTGKGRTGGAHLELPRSGRARIKTR